MRSKLVMIALGGAALAGCMQEHPDRGLAAVNVPVVTAANYVFDAAAPGGALAPGEPQRLDGWFQGLGLGYGDSIYIDGPYADTARVQVAEVAGQYGMLVQSGAPVTAGFVQPGTVRVVVSRRRASVPGCPNWSVPSAPNVENRTMSNFGCAVNSNFAAMVADPVDLVHGREASGIGNSATAVKALEYYRKAPPTGTKGLQDISTKESK